MEIITHLIRVGNSNAVRLRKKILQEADIKVGAEVSITVKNGSIVITPYKNARPRKK